MSQAAFKTDDVITKTDVRSYASLSAAITAIGSTPTTLVISISNVLGADLVIPANVTLSFIQGGSITTNGHLLTINSIPTASPDQQIFVGSGVRGLREAWPTWFGAKADGSTDDITAWNNTIASFLSPHGSITPNWNDLAQFGAIFHIPNGTSILSTQVVFTNSMPWHIVGLGQGSSNVKWTTGAATQGFSFTSSFDSDHIKLNDFTLINQQTNLGVAISIDMTGQYDAGSYGGITMARMKPRVNIDSITIEGSVLASYGWKGGILLTNVLNPRINGVVFTGVEVNGTTWDSANFADYAVKLTGAYSAPADVYITNSWFYCTLNAIYIDTTVEGVHVDHVSMVEVSNGIYWHAQSNLPWFTMTASHINSKASLVDMNNVNSIEIQGCLFYSWNGTGGDGLKISSPSGLDISHNRFYIITSSGAWNAIRLLSGTVSGKIKDNYFNFQNIAGVPIIIDSGATSNVIADNAYTQIVGNFVTNNGGNTNIINDGSRAIGYINTATYSTLNSTSQIVPFDTKTNDALGELDITTNKGRFTSKTGGFYHVDASVLIQSFANANASQFFELDLFVNGTRVVLGNITMMPVATVNTTAKVSSDLYLNAGDYLEAELYDNFGSHTVNGNITWTYMHVVKIPR